MPRLRRSVALFCLLALFSCRKTDNSIPSLIGTWQERETDHGIQFAGSSYRLSFFEDGHFQIRVGIFTDAIDLSNPCANSRIVYAWGSYSVQGNQLTLDGSYCDSSYTTPVVDCRYGARFFEQHTLGGQDGNLILDPEKDEFGRIFLVRE